MYDEKKKKKKDIRRQKIFANGRAFRVAALEKSAISGAFRRANGRCKHFNNKQATRAPASGCVGAPLAAMPIVDLHEIESLLAVRRDRRSPLVRMEIAD